MFLGKKIPRMSFCAGAVATMSLCIAGLAAILSCKCYICSLRDDQTALDMTPCLLPPLFHLPEGTN